MQIIFLNSWDKYFRVRKEHPLIWKLVFIFLEMEPGFVTLADLIEFIRPLSRSHHKLIIQRIENKLQSQESSSFFRSKLISRMSYNESSLFLCLPFSTSPAQACDQGNTMHTSPCAGM